MTRRAALLSLLLAVGIVVGFGLAIGSYFVVKGEGGADGLLAPPIVALLLVANLVAGIALLMAAYLSARNSRAMIVRPRNNSMDLCVLFLLYAAAQGALTAIVTRAFGG